MKNDTRHKNSIDTAMEQGREEGRAEGKADIVKAMLKRGMDIKLIAELSGLDEEEIRNME